MNLPWLWWHWSRQPWAGRIESPAELWYRNEDAAPPNSPPQISTTLSSWWWKPESSRWIKLWRVILIGLFSYLIYGRNLKATAISDVHLNCQHHICIMRRSMTYPGAVWGNWLFLYYDNKRLMLLLLWSPSMLAWRDAGDLTPFA